MADLDLSEFEALSIPTKKRPPCALAKVLPALDASEVSQFEAACAQETITTGAIVKWLLKRGHDIGVQRVIAHRRRKCACHD